MNCLYAGGIQVVERPTGTEPVTIQEITNALLLYNEPVLNSRFHELLSRLAGNERWQTLKEIPEHVVQSERHVRAAAAAWGSRKGTKISAEFAEEAERVLLESYLTLAESQLRMLAYMAKKAPEAEIRKEFDNAADRGRSVTGLLRETIPRTDEGARDQPNGGRTDLRLVQEETEHGDLRGQMESAIQRMRDAGKEPRSILLSHTGLRHLRDHGLFQRGETRVMGVPVIVDLEWEAPAFAIQSFESMSLDEMTYIE